LEGQVAWVLAHHLQVFVVRHDGSLREFGKGAADLVEENGGVLSVVIDRPSVLRLHDLDGLVGFPLLYLSLWMRFVFFGFRFVVDLVEFALVGR